MIKLLSNKQKAMFFIKDINLKSIASDLSVPYFVRLQGGDGSVGIYGCFKFSGVGLCNTYAGRIKQHIYRAALENCMVPPEDMLIERNERRKKGSFKKILLVKHSLDRKKEKT